MKKKDELSDDRIAARERAKQIHATNKTHNLYGDRAFVTTTTTAKRYIGPFVLPWMFDMRHQNTAKRNLVPLTPDRNVVMLDDGTIALRKSKNDRYEAFNFATGNSNDFDVVRRAINGALENQRKLLPPSTPR